MSAITTTRRSRTTGRSRLQTDRAKVLPTLILLIGAFYCLIPVAWVFIAVVD